VLLADVEAALLATASCDASNVHAHERSDHSGQAVREAEEPRRNLIDFSGGGDPCAECHGHDENPPSARKKADDETAKKHAKKDHTVIFGDAAF
jgi:hypothetical protein